MLLGVCIKKNMSNPDEAVHVYRRYSIIDKREQPCQTLMLS